jgi:hypothetical protein
MSPRAHIRRMLNGAWISACSCQRARFEGALGRVADTQERYLLNLLRNNARTRFGERHGFAQIRSVAEYQKRVPITGYEALAPHIEAIARGEAKVLTAEPVKLFQPTSGSTAATKLIPWTAGVAAEFRRGIAPWVTALYRGRPALVKGTAYWSVSPPATALQTHGRLRVGFAHDAEYLGFLGRKLFALVNAGPAEVADCRDMREFRTRTLVSLLADADLGLISVWSPTFLTILLEHFHTHRDEILERMRRDGGSRHKGRAELIQAISSDGRDTAFFEEVWPSLQVISCWTHGPSEIYAHNLRRFFPTVEIQGKGLIATEAFVSLPFQDGLDPVLAVSSHFFEFQLLASETVCLAHELVEGNEYRVIVTTGGGLYRYPLGDRVRVTGFIQGAPCLRFLGREGNVSDLFGEKLQGSFVDGVVRRALAQQGVAPSFLLLAPTENVVPKTGYALFLDAKGALDAARLARDLENGLAESFHYGHCRRLGQLSQVRVFQIEHGSACPEAEFEAEMLSRGFKVGDIKPAPLDFKPGWERRFRGRFVA